ncbi:hypothetical protein [Mycolicibacterium sediminis]|uniref:EfeO-type cupredoxin-like domain-containing protein n=1 Tax=Mycolicibacterium sediminis TaxID=1286180 RepID=A0A7I7QZ38_9MYCO|nr:hypothetical protein [Mycolicibacterium sediminis]BBY31535.1 hypothetical protein MSEDJ_56310 [Mycolicibacterium sediminis]
MLKAKFLTHAVPAVLVLLVVGCGPTSTTAQSQSSSASGAPTASSSTVEPSPSESAPQSPAPTDRTTVDITIANGTVTPTNGQVSASAGKPIVLQVASDTADQLHVHSVPEHTFAVEPRSGQSFEFTVDVPGQVDVELHDLNRTVVTIQVRP